MLNSKAVVIYSSKRGSTKQYAEWIASEIKTFSECTLVSITDSKKYNLDEYDLIVYGGWIRGSGIVDYDKMRSRLDDELLKKTIVFGVGVAKQTAENYMQVWIINLGKKDPKNENKTTLYILDGRYNPDTVTGFDGFLMKICKKVLKSGSTRDAQDDAAFMLDRLANVCDLVKKENITSLVKDCKKIINNEK